MKFSPVYWLTCVLMMVAASLSATTIVMPSDEALVAKSPVIVRGTVVSSGVVERNGALWTETVLEVEQTLKGDVGSQIVIREMGGESGDRITKIFGAPEYRSGERVLAFVTPTLRGDYQTVDLFVGKFTEAKTLSGQRLWIRNDQTDNVHMLDANFKEIEARNIQRDADGFEHYVGARVAGNNAPANYGVENPVIDTPALRGGISRDRISPDFTLISEPTLYRWFTFERGSTAQWFSYGQQTGYPGGGINEVRTAMNAWNNYTSARISYQYTGAASGTATTLNSPNGVNDIVFNDTRNEISGSWNPSTGGVVGQGGFNGVRNGGNWTSTFTADSTHTQRTYNAFDIVEGHMTIQDNVSPSTGITSSELAEIIAHEFGHTLGLGHSSDATALMYFQVTGLGPSLRTDDQLAARWLYPNGSAPNPAPNPTTVPAAPSNLAATVSGTSVALAWNDNASNETVQSIYVGAGATGNGGYSKVGDVGANARSATLSGFTAGGYRIYVSASNSAGESAPSNVVSVNVGVGVNASFSVSAASGSAGITNFAFTDQSTGPITSRAWDFGDGTGSNAANPTHIYAVPNTYTVTLTVSGGGTQSSATRQIMVTTPTVPLVASFTYSPSNPVANANIQFTDASTGGVTQWVWNFGDGTTSTGQNPVKVYANPGTYSVLLTAYRNASTAVMSQNITVGAQAPVTPAITAEFDFSPSLPDVGMNVAFTDRSTGSPTSWLWSFGDGHTSTSKNPTHTYSAAGRYFVTLTASNAGSSGNVTHTVTVSAVRYVYRSLIPVTTQTTGLNGANWRTELSIFNAGDEGANVTLMFIPGAGGAALTRSIFISPRQSAVYANALLDLFGLTSAAGAVQIEAEGATAAPALKVTSRTFTNGTRGTYGQAVPDQDFASFDQALYLTGMESDSQYRTNVGLVNKTAEPVAATLTLYSADGGVLGTNTVTVPANNFMQNGLVNLFPISGAQHPILSMTINAAKADAISVYASVVNNETNDPVYIQAIPAVQANRLVLPVIGRLPGINGTFFRSDVAYYNPTPATMTLSMRYLVSGADNRNVGARTMSLPPGRSILQADVLGTMGLTSGAGAFEITWNTPNGPIVTSRTYTTTETGGTFGQSIDPIQSFATRIDVTGLRSDPAFRSNAGFVNGGDATIAINVTLLSSTGQSLRTASIQLAPQSQSQYTLGGLFPGLDTATVGSFTLRADSSAPTMFAYGSIIDNGSGDPVFFAGR